MTASWSNWVVAFASAAFALNSTIFMAYGKSAYVVLFGCEPTLLLDLAITELSKCPV